MSNSAIIIGSGFAGLSAASFMAKAGWEVTIIEKNAGPGGRAGQFKENGFTFDKGPSWYWMPDVFERYFASFDRNVADYYQLQRLDPSYRVYWNDDYTDVPADFDALKDLFESIEPGSAKFLEKYLKEAFYKYEVGIRNLVHKPGRSIKEFLEWDVMKGMLRLDVFTSIRKHINDHFTHPKLRQLMEFPILFLGALPRNTPALYSLMNYADMKGGTWYPKGGMYAVVNGMYQLALELGVNFRFNEEVSQIIVEKNKARKVETTAEVYDADVVISGADYHFTEMKLLDPQYRSYSTGFWDRKVLAPSCLLYYIGLNKRLENITHHSLFFDVPFEQHAKDIYKSPRWPSDPLFYVSANSVSDDSVAPQGSENLVFLIPVAAGLKGDDETTRENYFRKIKQRYEDHTGNSIIDSISCKKTFSVSDFISEYNSYKGNAYGLANTLRQTAIFKPSCKSSKVNNLYYTGQLTVPGPGVPPCLISGEVVANEVLNENANKQMTLKYQL